MIDRAARVVGAVVLVMGGVAAAAPAWALGDADRGRETAQRWCSHCHVVADMPQDVGTDGAPPFPDIARDSDLTPALVEVFLQAPHPPMPDFQLSNADISDLVAYFESLGLE